MALNIIKIQNYYYRKLKHILSIIPSNHLTNILEDMFFIIEFFTIKK